MGSHAEENEELTDIHNSDCKYHGSYEADSDDLAAVEGIHTDTDYYKGPLYQTSSYYDLNYPK